MARSANRVAPEVVVNVVFEGTFTPASIQGRVSRCEVAAIGENGAIHYNVGITFDQPITFPDDDDLAEATAEVQEESLTLRNRW